MFNEREIRAAVHTGQVARKKEGQKSWRRSGGCYRYQM